MKIQNIKTFNVQYVSSLDELQEKINNNKVEQIEIIVLHNDVEIYQAINIHNAIKHIKHDIVLWKGMTNESEYHIEYQVETKVNDKGKGTMYIYSVDYVDIKKEMGEK